jgi:hypothetical protein
LKKPQLILFLQNDDDYAASDSSRCERWVLYWSVNTVCIMHIPRLID